MLIMKEQQEAWLRAYQKHHTTDECLGFVDGINKVLEYITQNTIKPKAKTK